MIPCNRIEDVDPFIRNFFRAEKELGARSAVLGCYFGKSMDNSLPEWMLAIIIYEYFV